MFKKKPIRKIISVSLLLLLFIFLLIIRVHDYARYPIPGNADELNYGWSGLGLLKTGMPVGWSGHRAYPKEWTVYDGVIKENDNLSVGVKMVEPWLDEPPLFSILAGLASYKANADVYSILRTSDVRIPSLIFGFGITILLFLLGKKLFNFKIGILSAVVFSLTPLILFGSRYALPENGISFLLVLSLYLYSLYRNKKRVYYLILISLCAGLAGLMKPTGFFIAPLFSFFIMREENDIKKALLIMLLTLPFVGGFLYYGYSLGGEHFWNILKYQGIRPSGWTGMGFLLSTPSYSTNTLYDGWYIFLVLTSIAVVFYKRGIINLSIITTSLIYWIIVIALSAGEQDLLAWYRYPLAPLFSILGSIAIWDMIQKPNLLRGLMAIGMLFSSRFYLHNSFMPTTSSASFKLMFILLAAPFVLSAIYYNSTLLKKIQQLTLAGIVVAGLFLNTKYIYNAYAYHCYNVDCPIQVESSLSHIRIPFFWRLLVPEEFRDTTLYR